MTLRPPRRLVSISEGLQLYVCTHSFGLWLPYNPASSRLYLTKCSLWILVRLSLPWAVYLRYYILQELVATCSALIKEKESDSWNFKLVCILEHANACMHAWLMVSTQSSPINLEDPNPRLTILQEGGHTCTTMLALKNEANKKRPTSSKHQYKYPWEGLHDVLMM